jgi:hypothetical protein
MSAGVGACDLAQDLTYIACRCRHKAPQRGTVPLLGTKCQRKRGEGINSATVSCLQPLSIVPTIDISSEERTTLKIIYPPFATNS